MVLRNGKYNAASTCLRMHFFTKEVNCSEFKSIRRCDKVSII